ncbi:MAG TPA: SpoIIE family protein phosphatase, partial [Streptosporangiaceae bacterium]|nr:SpoIIE family protein phosphatase [Streptosporangiaceae bacterium]
MTSGIPAKGSALGTSASEGGVRSSRAPLPRTSGNGTRRSRGSSNGTNIQEAGIADTPEPSYPALSSSVRTLILGIDNDGRVVQHDRNAAQILSRKPEDLLGAQLIELTTDGAQGNGSQPQTGSHARPSDAAVAVAGLLDAIRSDREGTAMLTIDTRDGHPAEAVVTVHPMRADGTSVAALALIRIPAPASERFVDPALMRRQMLDDALTRIGDTLDIDDVARVLLDAIVPHFCNVAGLLLLESLAGDDELPSHGPEGSLPLRRIALLHDQKDPAWEATFPTGEILRYPANTPYFRCMDTGAPVLEATITKSQASEIAKNWRRKPVAKLLSGASMAVLPLIARGTMLGFCVCTRQEGFRRFDAYDVEIGMDFASRAAVFIDNARRYSREHATALTLQRSMLPTGLSAPSSVEVRHRYLPGSKMIEVGGDWYESIALPGGRVALVVGDVAGHGVRAAVTMGRLRTAI